MHDFNKQQIHLGGCFSSTYGILKLSAEIKVNFVPENFSKPDCHEKLPHKSLRHRLFSGQKNGAKT